MRQVAPSTRPTSLAVLGRRSAWALLVLPWLVVGCRTLQSEVPAGPYLLPAEGMASYYGANLHGHLTANGERFDKDQLTAAHRQLPFGMCVLVTNLANGRSVRVRVNDRGPFVEGRLIDLSEAAARTLGMLEIGVARVRLADCT